MTTHTTTRRRLLRGMAGTGLTMGAIGVGSAQSTEGYIVTGGSSNRIERAGYSVERELAGGSVRIVSGPADAEADLDSIGGVSAVTRNFAVELPRPVGEVEPRTTDDAAFSDEQWDKQLTDTFEAHDIATGEGTRIAIADTGVDDTHPDLGNVNTDLSVSFINGDGTQGPHTGDSGYHGTHVAGIAAATGAVGVVGTAPDAELVSVQVLDNGGTFADILAGADYAADIGSDVANFSLGAGPYPPQANGDGLRVAVQKVMQDVARRGTALTLAAGNASTDLQRGGRFYLPSSVQGTMSVSATTRDDELADFSNYGTNEIHVGAPGASILSTFDPDNEVLPGTEYSLLSGTSMAAPQVAGLVGLVCETNPGANTNQIENAIAQGADLVQGRGSPEFGAGRINALDTVQQGGSPGRGNPGNGNSGRGNGNSGRGR